MRMYGLPLSQSDQRIGSLFQSVYNKTVISTVTAKTFTKFVNNTKFLNNIISVIIHFLAFYGFLLHSDQLILASSV